MSISLTFDANDTITLSGAGTSAVNGRYFKIFANYYCNENDCYMRLTAPTRVVYEIDIYSHVNGVDNRLYWIQASQSSGSITDSFIDNGASPAPSGFVKDTSNSYQFSITSETEDAVIVAGAGMDVNGIYLRCRDFGSLIGGVFSNAYFVWIDDEFYVIGLDTWGTWILGPNLNRNPLFYYNNNKYGTYTTSSGISPAPTVSEYTEPFAPTLVYANIDKTGQILTIEWDIYMIPLTGTAGLSIGNVSPAVTLSNITHSGNTTTAELSRALTSSDEPKLSYTKGNLKDSADEELENFANMPVVNNADAKRTGFFAFF